LASSVSAALSSEGSEAMADSEIQNMIQSHVQNMVAEQVMSGETQKTNLEEQNLVGIEQTVSKIAPYGDALIHLSRYIIFSNNKLYYIEEKCAIFINK